MPLVPMPGSAPRGWSFRHNDSDRTLGLKSTAHSRRPETPHEMESVAELPSESDHYDTPYRDEYKEEINTTSHSKSKRESKKSVSSEHRPSEPPLHVFDGPSDEDDSPSTAEASFAEDAPVSTTSTNSREGSYVSDQPSIALFGASGVTGGHFLTAALDAGYSVRCIPADDPREMGPHTEWDSIKLGLQDTEQLQAVVYRVDYVVIMLNDVLPSKGDYPTGFMPSFIERLYTVLREEPTVQVVLFQVRSECFPSPND